MLKTDALRAYDNQVKAVAAALSISISAVYQWGDIVPPYPAKRLSEMKPEIPYDPSVYKDWNAKFSGRKRKSRKRH